MVDPWPTEVACGGVEHQKENVDKMNEIPAADTSLSSDVAEKAPKVVWTLRKKMMIFTMCVTYFIALAAYSVISPFFPNEASKKGASKTVVGMVFSTYPLVGVILSPIYGLLIPRVGVRFSLISSFFVFGGVSLLFGFLSMMPDGAIFIAFCFLLRSFHAISGTGMETAYYIIIAVEYPDNIATVMGLLDTFIGLGLMAGPALGGVLFEVGGFKLPFVVLGGACWAILPLVWILLPKDKEQTSEQQGSSALQALKVPTTALMAFICFGSGMSLSFLDPVLAPYLKKECGLRPSLVGLLFLLSSATYCFSSPVVGRIGDKTKRYLLIITVGVLFNAAGFLLLGPSPFFESAGVPRGQVWLVCVALTIIGVSSAAGFVPVIPVMLQAAKAHGLQGDEAAISGIISGIAMSMLNVGALIGPTMSGALDQHLGFEWATTILAFILGAQGILLVVLNFCSRSMIRLSQTVSTSINDTDNEREPLLKQSDHATPGLL